MDVDHQPEYEKTPVNDNDVHNIVLSYLEHNGFKDTVESFVSSAGIKFSAARLEGIEMRKTIFNSAMEGNALKAFELTDQVAPGLLEKNKDLCFDLLSLQFVELICSRECELALEFVKTKLTPFGKLPKFDHKLQDIMTLLAYDEPEKSPMFHLLSFEYRQHIADSLNKAILEYANLPTSSALERSIQQTIVVKEYLNQECRKDGYSSVSVEEILKS